MSNDRSDALYHVWRESSEKLDYFVTGVSGAVTAYIGQNLHPVRVGINPPTVELLALTTLVGSVVCGFKRLESVVQFHRLQSQALRAEEGKSSAIMVARKGPMGIDTGTGEVLTTSQLIDRAKVFHDAAESLDPHIQKTAEAVKDYYHWRNRLLFGGFGLLVAARIYAAYA